MKQVLLLLILFILLFVPCLAQTKEATRFAVFDQSYYAEAIAIADAAASTLIETPNFRIYIIVAGHEKYAGIPHRYANRLRNYLVNHRRIDAKRVVAISGDCQEKQQTEIWLVPDGAKPPHPTCDFSSEKIPANQVTQFDRYTIRFPNEGEWDVWDGSFEDEFTRLGKVAELLKQRTNLSLYIIARAQGVYEYKPFGKKMSDGKRKYIQVRSRKLSDPLGTDQKIANGERRHLINKHRINPSRIIALGRGYSLLSKPDVQISESDDLTGPAFIARSVELWLVPNNTPKTKLSKIF
ncbi:MAG TPA: hypothetical protein VF556_02755 [Pyrinomonadaceae bacterium]|jgi:hypothetical protein